MTALRILGPGFEAGGRRCDRHFEIAEWQQLHDETEFLSVNFQPERAMTDTANEIDTGIRWTEGAVEVDATLVARGLNLPIEQFMAEMRRHCLQHERARYR